MTLGGNNVTQQQPEQQHTDLIGSLAGGLADKQAGSDSRSHMATWMIIVSVIVGIVGAIIMAVAAKRKDFAEGVNGFTIALSNGRFNDSAAINAAVSLGHLGLGVLIAGGALALAGLVVVAARR
jgi:hypothetical protein